MHYLLALLIALFLGNVTPLRAEEAAKPAKPATAESGKANPEPKQKDSAKKDDDEDDEDDEDDDKKKDKNKKPKHDDEEEEGDEMKKKGGKHEAAKPTIWQRATALLQNNEQHALALSQRDQTIADLRQQLANQTQELNELRAGRQEIENALNALGATPEQTAEIKKGKKGVVAQAVTQRAQHAAVELAAGQGQPAVPAMTLPADAGEAYLEALNQANAEPDPRKRGALFQAASERFMKTGKN